MEDYSKSNKESQKVWVTDVMWLVAWKSNVGL